MNNNILKKEERQYYINYFSKKQGQNYPCSNQIVVCAIISNKSYEAISEIMLKKNCILYRRTKDKIIWKSNLNNEIWFYIKNFINRDIRGYRFYKIMIDKNINKNLFYERVLPCCGLYCCEMLFI